MTELSSSSFFSDSSFHPEFFLRFATVWSAIAALPNYVRTLVGQNNLIEGDVDTSVKLVGKGIVIEKHAMIDAGAVIRAPAFISRNTYIGHAALIRENTLIGPECVVGHCSEVRNTAMFPRARAAHFNFIGDSIVGSRVNLGGGTIVSNFELNAEETKNYSVRIKIAGRSHDTHLTKMGAIIGDGVQTGSNCVLSPGAIIGRGTKIFPLVCVRKGIVAPDQVVRDNYYNKGS